MKQPISKLPWVIGTDVTIWTKNNNEPDFLADKVGESYERLDTEYIIEACNNYPKALELIKYFVKRVEEGSIQSRTTYKMYKDFLNTIDNELD